MQICRFAIALVVLLSFPSTLLLAEEIADHPKIGLVLSGGGARGGAHVGVLKALEELDVQVDYIAGTSMGAIIGALYASGYSPGEIENFLIETDWKKGLTDQPDRRHRTMRKKLLERQDLIPYRLGFNKGSLQLPLGAVEGQHLDQIFHELFLPVAQIKNFDHLPLPFRAVATDLVTGEAVVLSEGSLANSVRASMSVPGVFAPVRIDGRLLVDGGMANNLPVDVVRSMGADIVIAVDISSPMLTEEQLTSILSVTQQITNFLTRRNADRQIASLGPQDILILPELGSFSSADFEGAAGIVTLGYEASVLFKDRLAALASAPDTDSTLTAGRQAADYIVEFVEIENDSVLSDRLIQSRLAAELGQPLDLDALNDSVDSIYSLDVFESVTYDMVVNDEGQQGIVVHANSRDWGPNYLQFGLELASDFYSSSDFTLGVAYTRNALNRLGGELRTVGSLGRVDQLSFDFYQPIDNKASWFVEPQVFWRRQNYNLWLENTNIAEYEISGLGFGLEIGRNFNAANRMSLGYQFSRGDADIITGDLGFPIDDKVRIGELNLEYLHDSLDYPWFPTNGMRLKTNYIYAPEELGAAFDFQQLDMRGVFAWSSESNTYLLRYEGGYSFDNTAPFERWYQLGGLGRLSGLVPDQLTGRHSALASMVYYRRINQLNFFKIYAGFTLEAGNVWDRSQDIGFDDLRYSGSVFLGADSPIGPMYLAYGRSDGGESAIYFYVGNPFGGRRFD